MKKGNDYSFLVAMVTLYVICTKRETIGSTTSQTSLAPNAECKYLVYIFYRSKFIDLTNMSTHQP
jgi:hypothetical protein